MHLTFLITTYVIQAFHIHTLINKPKKARLRNTRMSGKRQIALRPNVCLSICSTNRARNARLNSVISHNSHKCEAKRNKSKKKIETK